MAYITAAGRLTRDAEVKFTPSGDAITVFSVADDVGYGDKKVTQFFNCQLWGKRGESLAPYLTKGSAVTVCGEFSARKYATKDGTERTSLDIRLHDIKMQGGKSDAPRTTPPTPPKAENYTAAPQADELDDDIPF